MYGRFEIATYYDFSLSSHWDKDCNDKKTVELILGIFYKKKIKNTLTMKLIIVNSLFIQTLSKYDESKYNSNMYVANYNKVWSSYTLNMYLKYFYRDTETIS